MRTIITSRMRDLPVGLRVGIRALSLGPIAWGGWAWTFHDGSCWAALAFDGHVSSETMLGWCVLTMETDTLPVIGAYVHEDARGQGLGESMATALLQYLLAHRELYPGAAIFAATQRWPKWTQVIERCGLRCLTWV